MSTKYVIAPLVVSLAVPEGTRIDEDGDIVLPDGSQMMIGAKVQKKNPGEMWDELHPYDEDVHVANVAYKVPRLADEAHYS